MGRFEDFRKVQAMIMPLAEQAAGRSLLAERVTINKSIAEYLDAPSPATTAGVAKWADRSTWAGGKPTAPAPATRFIEGGTLTGGSPVMEQAPPASQPPSSTLVEALAGAIKTGRHLLGRDLTEAEARDLADTLRQRETAKGTALTEAELSKLDNAGFRERLGEAQMHANGGRSPFFRPPQVRTGGQLSESAPAVQDQSMEALAAKMNALPVHSIERREAWESLRDAYARTQPFGGRRLDSGR